MYYKSGESGPFSTVLTEYVENLRVKPAGTKHPRGYGWNFDRNRT
jgi:hypothetical protein